MRNKELFRGRRKAGRIVGLVLTLALAVSLLSGCGQSKERLTFGTGGTAGTYYSYGGVLAQYITNNTNVKVTAVSTGGSKANLQSVQDGDFQLGFVQSDVMANAWDGVRAFEQDGATHDFRTLGGLYAETVQLFTMDPDIKTVEDLKGKSVSIGAANSGVYFNALDVLNAGGITLDDIHPQYLSFEDSKESLKDGKIDAAFIVAGAPTTAITELATTNGVYMINIDGAKVSKSTMTEEQKSKLWAKDLIAHHGGNTIRWVLISAHYRAPLNLSDETIDTAKKELTKIQSAYKQAIVKLQLVNFKNVDSYDEDLWTKFIDEINDDLNTPNAIAQVFETVKILNQSLRVREIDENKVASLVNALEKMMYVLGIKLDHITLSDADKATYQKWQDAKKEKDFAKADEYRTILQDKGIL